MIRKYVVIDTNVLVSALITRNENSPTVQILRFLANGNIVSVYSNEIIKEYNEVLRRDKFKPEYDIGESPRMTKKILSLSAIKTKGMLPKSLSNTS